jgi:hypothetical protein
MSWAVRVTMGMSIVMQHADVAHKHSGRFLLMANGGTKVLESFIIVLRVHGDVRVLGRSICRPLTVRT